MTPEDYKKTEHYQLMKEKEKLRVEDLRVDLRLAELKLAGSFGEILPNQEKEKR
jgi:hypothetical protein